MIVRQYSLSPMASPNDFQADSSPVPTASCPCHLVHQSWVEQVQYFEGPGYGTVRDHCVPSNAFATEPTDWCIFGRETSSFPQSHSCYRSSESFAVSAFDHNFTCYRPKPRNYVAASCWRNSDLIHLDSFKWVFGLLLALNYSWFLQKRHIFAYCYTR